MQPAWWLTASTSAAWLTRGRPKVIKAHLPAAAVASHRPPGAEVGAAVQPVPRPIGARVVLQTVATRAVTAAIFWYRLRWFWRPIQLLAQTISRSRVWLTLPQARRSS